MTSLSKLCKVIFLVIFCAAVFSGCMNTQHLKDLVIVEGMGIDEKNNEIELNIQTLNFQINSSSELPSGNMTTITSASGDMITDSISNLSQKLSKRLFFGQNKLIVIGNEIAKNNLDENIDYFLRSSDSRSDVAVCIAEDEAKSVIESEENDSSVPAENILYLIKDNEELGMSVYVTAGDILNLYTDETSDIYMPVISAEKDSVKSSGIGLFSGSRLVYTTDDDETMGFLLINGKVKSATVGTQDSELGEIGIKITDAKTKNSVSIVDGTVVFNVEIKADMSVDEIQNGLTTDLSADDMEKIRILAEEKVKELCKKAFYACRDNNSDSLRVGDYLAKDSPVSYELLSDNWDYYFTTVQCSVNADIMLKKISENTELN